jgi:hypothetical protein
VEVLQGVLDVHKDKRTSLSASKRERVANFQLVGFSLHFCHVTFGQNSSVFGVRFDHPHPTAHKRRALL